MSINLVMYLVKVEKEAAYIIFLNMQKVHNRVAHS